MVAKALKPRLRFSGFTDAWEKRQLGEVGDFSLKTNSLSRSFLGTEGDVKNIHYGDILTKYSFVLEASDKSIPQIINSKEEDYLGVKLQNGDLIFADAAEDYSVGKAVEITSITDEVIVSGLHTIVVRPLIKFADSYAGYYVNSDSFHNQLLPLIQGAKVSSISKSNLSKTFFSYPSYPEQTAIGTFFAQLDLAIALQER